MLLSLTYLLLAILCIAVIGYSLFELSWLIWCRPPHGLRRVPGPKGHLIFGNIAQLSTRPQREFQQWARTYGELFQIRLGLTNWIYVNSVQAIREIFDKQSAYTASRLPTPVASDLIGGDMRFVLMADNAKWKYLRSLTHKTLTPSKSMTYMPSQDFEAKQLAHDLLVNNEDGTQFYTHVRRFATSVIMTTKYGWRLPSWDCEDIKAIYDILHELSDSMVPGTYLADAVPFLAHLPSCLQWWRKDALKHLDYQTSVWMKYWNRLREDIEAGKAYDSFGKQLIENEQGMTELEKAFLAGSLLEAGAETTSTTINSCLRYLAMNPNVQARAHEELDRVVGASRAPDFSDQGQLPYIEACFRETSRLRPPSNNGVLHYTTADLSYKDFYIPKNTVVAMNQYALYYDPARYEDPEKFWPERFLCADGSAIHNNNNNNNANDKSAIPDRWVFGAGRRICPGMHFAINSMYIALAKVLWAFEMRKPLDRFGREMELDVSHEAYEDGRFTVPRPYRLRLIRRSAKTEAIVRRDWEEANKAL